MFVKSFGYDIFQYINTFYNNVDVYGSPMYSDQKKDPVRI